MQIGLVTLFPEMFSALTQHGISGRAVRNGLVGLHCYNPRDFTTDRHRTVDDKPFGGGPGMLMKTEPLVAAIKQAKAAVGKGDSKVLYLSPQGRKLDQRAVVEMAQRQDMVLVCGRYQGIDERVLEMEIDEEWSLGDFVLSGGEIAAMALLDAVIRFLPGALGDEDSAQQDSFADGLLHCPQYTRPQVFAGREVPAVLLSGDHAAIRRWRMQQSLGMTWRKRPDLLQQVTLTEEQKNLLDQFVNEQTATKHSH